eukprot:6492685-Amphidinium_carterae.6
MFHGYSKTVLPKEWDCALFCIHIRNTCVSLASVPHYLLGSSGRSRSLITTLVEDSHTNMREACHTLQLLKLAGICCLPCLRNLQIQRNNYTHSASKDLSHSQQMCVCGIIQITAVAGQLLSRVLSTPVEDSDANMREASRACHV